MGTSHRTNDWPPEQLPASGVRHGILALTTLMAVLLYLDRVCISQAALPMARDLRLDKEDMGLVLGAFFFTYALMQVPAGWLGDRVGARLVLTGCVLGWSLCTALTGLVSGLVSLVAARLLLGVFQGGAYPIAARINSLWIPFERRAFASGMVSMGGRAGGALAPFLTAYLIVGLGWRPAFGLYGLLGLAWAVVFWQWFRATPRDHPGCNPAEVSLIDRLPPDATSPSGVARAVPWGAAFRSVSLWMQCLTQLTGNFAWTILITWLPTYLKEVHHVSEEQAGLLASVPLLMGMVGCLLGGILTDWLTARVGLKGGRNFLGMGSKYLAAVGLLAAIWADDPLLATAAMALTAFATDIGLGATWAYFQDAGGPYVGTLLGWANMFGNLGSFLSPLVLGWLADDYGWGCALGVGAGVFVVSGLFWFGVDARIPVVAPERP